MTDPAERSPLAPTSLPWLAPAVSSLLALCRPEGNPWADVRDDRPPRGEAPAAPNETPAPGAKPAERRTGPALLPGVPPVRVWEHPAFARLDHTPLVTPDVVFVVDARGSCFGLSTSLERRLVYHLPLNDDWVVLDALNYIKDKLDGSLSYRWSCRMGVCGSCGMMVNGDPKLTCATFLTAYTPGPIRVEPFRSKPPLTLEEARRVEPLRPTYPPAPFPRREGG